MLITNPSLVLTFTQDGTEKTTKSIELDSIKMQEVLLNDDLSCSSNSVQLSIIPDDSGIITNILHADRDIRAVLMDESDTVFTGYISDSYTWRISVSGEEVFSITLEDVGSRLLNRTWSDEDGLYIREKFSDLVAKIRQKAGNAFAVLYDSSVTQAIKDSILLNKIDSGVTLQTILDQVCFELGLVYWFNEDGNLVIKAIDIEANPAYDIYSQGGAYNLYSEERSGIELVKKARQYTQSKVRYDVIEDSMTEVPIFKMADKLELPAGHWWDGADHDNANEPVYELTLDEFFDAGKTYYTKSGNVYTPATVTPGDIVPDNTYYEYANLAGTVDVTDLDKGKDILYIYPATVKPGIPASADPIEPSTMSNTSYPVSPQPGDTIYVAAPTGFANSRWALRQHGNTDKLDVLVDNTGSATRVYYDAFQAGARIIRKTSTASVFKAAKGLTANSEVQYTYDAKWIHDRNTALRLATLTNNWYLYCGAQYTFYLKDNIPLGSIVNIHENVFSNLDLKLILTSRTYTMNGLHPGLYTYTAFAIADFSLTTVTAAVAAQPQTFVPTYDVNNALFDLNLSNNLYRRNSRKSSKQRISVTVTIQGYAQTSATVTADNGSFDPDTSVQVVTLSAGQTATLYVPYDNDYDVITLTAILNSNTDVTRVIGAVNETAEWQYLGALPTPPIPATFNYDKFAIGDHFLCTADSADYKAGNAYAWTGEEWWEASTGIIGPDGSPLGEDFYATVITNCLNDAVDANLPGTTQLGSWMQKLAANEIITNTLMAKELIMRNTGVLRSAQYTENENFPTSGYKLTSADGTLKAMNAFLRDVNIKCTDSQNAILLQTQRYQAGASNIGVRRNWSARWCIDDLNSTLATDSQTPCTYNGASKYLYKPSTTVYTYGYRYLISTSSFQSGGWGSSGDSVYTFPVDGYYYIHAPRDQYVNPGLNLWSSTGKLYEPYGGDMLYDLGYMSAGSQVLVHDATSYRVYLYNADWKTELSNRNSETFSFPGGSWAGVTQGFRASVFTGYNYIPEIWVSPGSAMERSVTTSNFDSSQNLNMYALSESIAGWGEGFYMCASGSTVTVGSSTLTVSNIGISSAGVTFTDANYNSVQVSLPVVGDSVAETGWAKNLNGTINLTAQRSAILTRDVLPSNTNQCWLGDSNNAWYQVVSYGFNSLSSREKKRDVEDFDRNATDIINGTKVVSFHYKDDTENKPRVGFIAEDTDKLLSTPTQDQFDLNNSVGLLLKAVQELSARIDRLEQR